MFCPDDDIGRGGAMDSIEQIKRGVERLYKISPSVHISVNKARSRIFIERVPARIVGVYKNIFQIEECESGTLPQRHTFQYGDVLIGQVVIEELQYAPAVSTSKKKSV